MDFNQSLKKFAIEIINIAQAQSDKVSTWDQSPGAPDDGYNDRTGYIINDGIELYSDVALIDEGMQGVMRARIAKIMQSDGQEIFNIVTMDFSADRTLVEEIIKDKQSLSFQKLMELLQNETTQPKLIHVSLESGTDTSGKMIGTRFEYKENEITRLTPELQASFMSTIEKTLRLIKTI
jgi:hypothetical protein